MLNFSFSYRPLFTFSLLHEYYANEILSEISIIPTKQSLAKAQSMGFIAKQTENKFSILCEEDKLELVNLLPTEELKFSFFIYTNNLYFNNFTQLPIEKPDNKILYFSNLNDNKGTLPSGKMHIHENVSEENYIDLSLVSHPFPEEHPIKKPIAFVEISIPELLKKEITDFTPFNELTTHDYFIKFSARKTYWKYAFVSRSRKLEKAEVVPGEGLPASFSQKSNEVLLNNQEAFIFISDEPLVLKQFSEYNLKLTQKNKASKDTEILPRLPVPSIEMIKPESRAIDTKVFSEIVVYI
jgi:hypothetical protein